MFKGSGYYRGYFDLKRVGDTFLNLSQWGKGQAYVNGHPIGRFWSIGPQQTLYVPGCWLNKGRNELVILDVVGPSLEAYALSIAKTIGKPIAFVCDGQEYEDIEKFDADWMLERLFDQVAA